MADRPFITMREYQRWAAAVQEVWFAPAGTPPPTEPPAVKVVRVTREKLYPVPGRSYRRQWKWTYSYSVDGEPFTGYGTGLNDIKGMLKRRFPKAEIVLTWEKPND